ncbi:hypothetical protein [Streptomyces sp. NPDC001450]
MAADQYSWTYETLVFSSRMGYFDRRHFQHWHCVLEWIDSEIGDSGNGVFDRAVVIRLCTDHRGLVHSEGRVRLRAEDFSGSICLTQARPEMPAE